MTENIAFEKKQSLCWDCKRSCVDQCSWAARFEPVKGWTAIKVHKDDNHSFCVLECPEFCGDPLPRDPHDLNDTGCHRFVEAIVRRSREDYITACPDLKDDSLTCQARKDIERFLREIGVKKPLIEAMKLKTLINDYVKQPKDREKIEEIIRGNKDEDPPIIGTLREEAAKYDEEHAKKKPHQEQEDDQDA